jgi:hypothetical protein
VTSGRRILAVFLFFPRRLRTEDDPLEVGVDAFDAVLGVLLLPLEPLLTLRVLLRLAVELLASLLEIVVGFSRQDEETPLQSCSRGLMPASVSGRRP